MKSLDTENMSFKLDSDDCVDLLTLLKVFNAIGQEQAWAVCYQTCKLLHNVWHKQQQEQQQQMRLQEQQKQHCQHKHVDNQTDLNSITNTNESTSNINQDRRFVVNDYRHNQQQPQSPQHTNINSSDSDNTTNHRVCHIITGLDQIFIHKDGYVHEKTCLMVPNPTPQRSACAQSKMGVAAQLHPNKHSETTTTTTTTTTQHHHHQHQHQHQHHQQPNAHSQSHPHHNDCSEAKNEQQQIDTDTERRPATNEGELISSLGLALFLALDYGLSDDEERTLSQALEIVVYQLTTVSMALSLAQVLDICVQRLSTPTPSQADQHYRNECRSLVLDALELSEFLDRIYKATKFSDEFSDVTDVDLDNGDAGFHDQVVHDLCGAAALEPLASLKALRISEWARLWMQVIRELRQREQFKSRLVC